MRIPGLGLSSLGCGVTIIVLAGCGESSSLSPASGVVPPSATNAARTARGMPKVRSESVVYAFTGSGGGARPYAGVIDVNGTLYGTTAGGDSSTASGTIYSVSPSGAVQTVYAFKGNSDGAYPTDSLIELNGVLYGTTQRGGSGCPSNYGCGTVFAVDPLSGTEQILYRFHDRSDGAAPYAGLIAVHGTLYGTTFGGGNTSCHCGTIFSVNPVSGRERVLYRFKGGSDGANPQAGLVALHNTLYGTTYNGGFANCPDGLPGCGTVFAFNMSSRSERVMYRFQPDHNDGEHPAAALVAMQGTLYGTTTSGGVANCPGFVSTPCGTVFSIQPSSNQERIVYSFKGDPDGLSPNGPLLAAGGVLYGTTYYGGASGASRCGQSGCGTVFKLTAAGKERVLYSFQHIPDGAYPMSGLISVNGTLYGTTAFGGTGDGNGGGTVFKVLPQ